MQKILLIGGSTSSGKTKLALELSKFLNIEIINADSIQVYKDLNIGTSKPSADELKMCPHYLINELDITEKFNVYNFVQKAKKLINEIEARGNLPVIVGGTGLYMDALIFDYSFKKNEERKSFDAIYDYNLIMLNLEREKLYKKINAKVDEMLADGFVDEVKSLIAKGLTEECQCAQAIGYKEIMVYLRGEIPYEEAVEKMKQNTRNYAKRQITWFKHMNGKWINAEFELIPIMDYLLKKYRQFLK